MRGTHAGQQAPPIQRLPARTCLVRLLAYLKPYWREQAICLALLLAGTGALLLIPLLVRELLDVALPRRDTARLAALAGAMAILHGLYGLLMFATDFFFLRVGNGVVRDLRASMHRHLISLSLDYFTGTKAGQIQARFLGDVDAIQTVTTNAFLMLVADTFALLLMLGFMLYLSLPMTLIGLGTLAALVALFRMFNGGMLARARATRSQYGRVAEELQEAIAGLGEIKAYAQEDRRNSAFLGRLQEFAAANIRMGLWGSASRQLSLFVIALGPVLVYLYGGLRVVHDAMTLGTLMAFAMYLSKMYEPVQRLTFLNVQVQAAIGALERIFSVFQTQPTVREDPRPMALPHLRRGISLVDVGFGYNGPGGRPILEGVSLSIRKGEQIAIVGASGSGKTTLAKLICRFYDVDHGAILFDDTDVRSLRVNDVRRLIGIVSQETFLFHATIAENLRLARPEATPEDLARAARLAHAAEFIAQLPEGYETVVGERGTKLSGGQRQRLSIARAILKDPEIVILDEATSSLDSESTGALQASLGRLMQGRTTIIISHRLSTIVDADRIVVLHLGRIAQEGTHETLMQAGGVYGRLFEQEIREYGRPDPVLPPPGGPPRAGGPAGGSARAHRRPAPALKAGGPVCDNRAVSASRPVH